MYSKVGYFSYWLYYYCFYVNCILSISFAKLIFSTFALFLFLFLVFSWIVSFIPGFELSVFSAFAKTLGYIILSACMTFLFVIVGLCIKLANSFY
ncbi:putative mating channel protein [Staphylococcus aureus]|nr:putative mating channel protein [Staphylococcus aureus]